MRKIDGKFHFEDDQIIKTSNGEPIPEDEPVFLLRARDWLALDVLNFYHRRCLEDECTDYQLVGVYERIKAFQEFRTSHPERMKQPGIIKGL